MRFPVGEGTPADFLKFWYNADPWDSWRGTYFHGGPDLNLRSGGNTDCGQPLYAVADGAITSVEFRTTGFGKHLHLQCVGPWGTVYFHYAHCSEIVVREGQTVKEGELLGFLGTTGNSQYCHLHFEGKKKPVGINAVAKTKEALLDGWFEPITFINQWIGVPTMSKLLDYLGADSEDAAIARLDEHLGTFNGKSDWGTPEDGRGGFLGSARRRIKELEAHPVPTPPTVPPTVDGWEVNGLQVVIGDKTWNYRKN